MKMMLMRCLSYGVVAAVIHCAIAVYFLKAFDGQLLPGTLFTGVITLLISCGFYSYYARQASKS